MPTLNNFDADRTEEVQDILSRTPSWMISWGNTVILIILMSILFLSYLIKYPDLIEGNVYLTSEIPPVKKVSRISGTIDKLFIKDGDLVEQDQLLAIFKNAADYQVILTLKKELLKFRTHEYNKDFNFNSISMGALGQIAPDFANFEKALLNFRMNEKLKPFSEQFNANRNSISELNRRLQNTIEQKEIKEKTYNLGKNNLERKSKLYDRGVISKQEFEFDQIDLLNQEQDLKNFNSNISQIKQNLSDAINNKTKTQIDSEMMESQLRKEMILATSQLFKSIKDWELLYTLKANIYGKIAFFEVWNENQNVEQGQNVFSIIPLINDHYLARMKAPARNSGKIRIGQKVNIHLLGYPENEFGVLMGNVKSISALPNESGLYYIDISLDEPLKTTYGNIIPFQYELNGTAEIITSEVRLIERIFVQFKSLFKYF